MTADLPRTITRRGLLAAGSTLGAATFLADPAAAAPVRRRDDLVETSAGWVRGTRTSGVSAFLGVPYGAAERFRPPADPAPWRGVRDATAHGHIAPQPIPGARLDYTRLIGWLDQPGGQSEDCLVLNVWTPRPDGARRPVLVSFHGGGFSSGSGNHRGFDGDPLARFGDVVVVTVNHRLGLFGFLHLADLGAPAEWATAGVNGMLDAVAALRWVNRNIAAFGGDPNRVMVFGQSGGGAKTSTLLAMPSARGLLHRAAVQSGSTLTLASREAGTRNASRLLARLGLSTRRLTELRDVPMAMMVSAQAGLEAATPPAQFAPVVDGVHIPRDPFSPTAPEVSRDVPMIISATRDEATAFAADPELTDAGLVAAVRALAGEANAGAGDRRVPRRLPRRVARAAAGAHEHRQRFPRRGADTGRTQGRAGRRTRVPVPVHLGVARGPGALGRDTRRRRRPRLPQRRRTDHGRQRAEGPRAGGRPGRCVGAVRRHR